MKKIKPKLRMILATLGLEVHWRGAVTVARMLRDEGVEVIYLGNAFPNEIIQAAVQEDADIVGVSTLTGGHLFLGKELLELATQKDIRNKTVFTVGGIIPPSDIPRLKEAGFDGIFGPGTTGKEIYEFLCHEIIRKKRVLKEQS